MDVRHVIVQWQDHPNSGELSLNYCRKLSRCQSKYDHLLPGPTYGATAPHGTGQEIPTDWASQNREERDNRLASKWRSEQLRCMVWGALHCGASSNTTNYYGRRR